MKLLYVDGPLDGTAYPLEKGQPLPREIRHQGWRGHYALMECKCASRPVADIHTCFAPHLLWRGK